MGKEAQDARNFNAPVEESMNLRIDMKSTSVSLQDLRS